MKLKIKKTEREMIVDYYKYKQIDKLRLSALEYTVGSFESDIFIIVDTNHGVEKSLQKNEAEILFSAYGIEYRIEPTADKRTIPFGLKFLFGRKSSPKKELLILLKVNKSSPLKEIYEGFLKGFDYGVGTSEKYSMDEIMIKYSQNSSEVYFNKDVFTITLYDSLLFSRIRTDWLSGGLGEYLSDLS